MLTPKSVINIVCQVLELDVEKLSIKGKQVNQKYRDARLIATYLMRKYIFEDRVVMSKIGGKRVYCESEKHITYKEISKSLNRKAPETSMASYLACNDLLKTNKEFRLKYQSVIEEMDKKGMINIETQSNGR